ncbi:Uu.00g009110.m01.CDS01 [Anthostomella pinea]|uniref:Non-structural maintenance of chromosomes element 1 homolog n=1 Tax=Anthostomella pinea TaxID=933095 RepID=A0AAI8VXB6_9PEZI|nr:Uu.00g009110.m01.CDS01 [Anthostomella pinea]
MSDDDQDDIPARYNDGNRAFLQAFMARGTMTFKESQPILAAIFTAQENEQTEPNQVTQEQFASYVSAASAAISPFDLEIRSTLHQTKKVRVYALVNTTSDLMTQLATLHNADEIAFIKRVIDAMFEKYNTPRQEVMGVDGMQAIKLRTAPRQVNEDEDMENGESQPATQSLKGLKATEVETVMASMVDEGWFERTGEGLYSLSPRALMELRSWLVESYNDPDAEEGEWQRVKFCEACKEIVTVGQRCPERDCNARLHDICEDAFWRTRRQRKCPRCEKEWTGTHFVGARAVTETEAYQRGRRKSGKGGRSSNLVEHIMHDGEEDEDDED